MKVLFRFSLWIKPYSVTILWKATELNEYIHVALFVLTFYSADQTTQFDYSLETAPEQYFPACVAVCFVQCGLMFRSVSGLNCAV